MKINLFAGNQIGDRVGGGYTFFRNFHKGLEQLGLQISDWIASPMSKMVGYPNGREDKYGEWELYKNKIWIGKDAPGRGQVGFKVFPRNIGRRLLNMPLKSAKDSK